MRRAPIALLLLAACAPKPAAESANPDTVTPPTMAPPPGAAAAVFSCDDKSEIFALFATDSSGTGVVSLAIGDERVRLRQVASASGARYADSTTTFWNKGNEVTFERGGKTITCTTMPTASEPTTPPAEKPAGSE